MDQEIDQKSDNFDDNSIDSSSQYSSSDSQDYSDYYQDTSSEDSDDSSDMNHQKNEKQASNWEKITELENDNIVKFAEAQTGPINTQNLEINDFIMLYLNDRFIQNVLTYTNDVITSRQIKRAQLQKHQESISNHTIQVKQVSKNELLSTLGICYLFGLTKKPKIRSYWENSKLFSVEGIREVMSRDRFQIIYSSLTFHKRQEENTQRIRFYEVKELITHFISISQQYYIPKRELSADELMTKFSGYDPDKQYIPSKPIKFGYKSQALSDSSNGKQNYSKSSGLFTELVIIDLVKDYSHKGYSLYMDSMYTSIKLFMKLNIDFGFNCCGSISTNRLGKFDVKKLKGQFKSIKENEILFYKLNLSDIPILLSVTKQTQKNPMRILSTYSSTNSTKAKQMSNHKQRETIKQTLDSQLTNQYEYNTNLKHILKKEILISQQQADYNKFMGGVDRFDQLCSYYMPNHRSYRRYFRISIHVLEMMLINSFILYKETFIKQNRKYASLYEYRKTVIRFLVSFTRNEKQIQNSPKRKNAESNLIQTEKGIPQFVRLVNKKGYGKKCQYCPKIVRQGCFQCRKFVCQDDQQRHIHI